MMAKTLALPFTDKHNRKPRLYTWTRVDGVHIVELDYHNDQKHILPFLKAEHLPQYLHRTPQDPGRKAIELRARDHNNNEVTILSLDGLHNELIAELRLRVRSERGNK